MIDLSTHIRELLANNDCVIVPGFGGFVLNSQPARIDELQHKFYPPGKSLSFNKKLQQNDGLLAHHIGLQTDQSYDDALQLIHEAVMALKRDLSVQKSVVFQHIGAFRQDNLGTLVFEPQYSEEGGVDTFGLEPFHALPIDRSLDKDTFSEKVIPVQNSSKEKEQIFASATTSPKRNWVKTAALGAIALPLVGYVTWLGVDSGIFKQDKRFHYSDLNPFSEKICELYVPNNSTYKADLLKSEEALFELPPLEELESPYVELKLVDEAEGTVTVQVNEVTPPIISQNSDVVSEQSTISGYYIIAGCFGVRENAERLVKELQHLSYEASILDKDKSLFRVSAGRYSSQEEAKDALQSFKTAVNSSAWLTKK